MLFEQKLSSSAENTTCQPHLNSFSWDIILICGELKCYVMLFPDNVSQVQLMLSIWLAIRPSSINVKRCPYRITECVRFSITMPSRWCIPHKVIFFLDNTVTFIQLTWCPLKGFLMLNATWKPGAQSTITVTKSLDVDAAVGAYLATCRSSGYAYEKRSSVYLFIFRRSESCLTVAGHACKWLSMSV